VGCKDGPDLLLADAFDRELNDCPGRIPRSRAGGSTLLMVADFGGSHTGQFFETYFSDNRSVEVRTPDLSAL
jgi:hypothetical protein